MEHRSIHEVKWEEELNVRNIAWGKVYNLLHNITRDTALISFQYKIVHRIIVTNNKLKLWKIIESENCSFCKRHPESICHLFFVCKNINTLWRNLAEWLLPELDILDCLDLQNLILG